MRYLTLVPDYTGSCIQDDFEVNVSLEKLNLPKNFINQLTIWHNLYRAIIPLSENERKVRINEIEELDKQGLQLAKTLKKLIPGGAKIKYFSEGKLVYLPIDWAIITSSYC